MCQLRNLKKALRLTVLTKQVEELREDVNVTGNDTGVLETT